MTGYLWVLLERNGAITSECEGEEPGLEEWIRG
jgi:hypothetical protein